MHPLTSTCLAISRCGYSSSKEVHTKVALDKLQSLAAFLLEKQVVVKKPEEDNSVAICFGSGIDSYCALALALKQKRKVILVQVGYGQPYAQAEFVVFNNIGRFIQHRGAPNEKSVILEDLKRFKDVKVEFKYAQIPIMEKKDCEGIDWENYIIPARNLVLAAEASQYSHRIWIVATSRKNEMVGARDKTSRFFSGATELFTEFYGYRHIVESPFFGLTKQQVVEEYIAANGNIAALTETFSCYSPIEVKHHEGFAASHQYSTWKHCSTCLACYKRWKLFKNLGIETKDMFAADPQKGKNYEKFAQHEAAKGRE